MKRIFIVISLLALLVSCDIIPKECEQLSDMIGDIPGMDEPLVHQLFRQEHSWVAKFGLDKR